MKFDAVLADAKLSAVPLISKKAELMGFDAIWTQETQHDPFLPHTLIAEHTSKMLSGTNIAVGFSRSPMNIAYTAWDLAQQSEGRFILGIGTQIKPHIERRFGMAWPRSVTSKLREQILAMRAIWNSWQYGDKLNFRGEYYKLTLMTPFFTPPPIDHPNIPIYIAGVNKGLAALAGELCDGFMIHPFHTSEYLKEELFPAIRDGKSLGVNQDRSFTRMLTVFAAITDQEVEEARKQIAFYASTPTYSSVLEFSGYANVAVELSKLASRGRWTEMSSLINDDILEKICVIGNSERDLARRILDRYEGLAERITLYKAFKPDQDIDLWQELIAEFHDRSKIL